MNSKERLPIWRDSNRLLLVIEQAVRGFPRYHKYTVGSDLRREAMQICRLLVRALSAKGAERLHGVQELRLAVDDIKVTIQLAKELQAFQNFSQFQCISELAVAIGKQGGAWYRQLAARTAGSESVVR